MSGRHAGARRISSLTMEHEAGAFLAGLDERGRAAATGDFGDTRGRRWIEYRPERRPGLALADMAPADRKAAYRLLATALSPAAFAQAMAVMALEEVLDRRENGRMDRHTDDYRVIVFGSPGAGRWAWRFEGHHLSVSMTVIDGVVSPAPVFLGANPSRVDLAGRPVLRPLGPEEDLGRELLLTMSRGNRERAVVAAAAPWDIASSVRPRAERLEPAGVARDDLRPAERAMLDQLVAVYLGRLAEPLADRLTPAGPVHFAWAGPDAPRLRHYYRIQADDLLIEFDQTDDGDGHAHTVLRRPRGDFGGDLLAAHHADAH
jgi:hypothetical protein